MVQPFCNNSSRVIAAVNSGLLISFADEVHKFLLLLSSFCDMFQPDKKQHASHTNFLCNIFTLSKGNICSISLWISSRLFVRNLHWWNKSSLNYQKIDLKSYKSLAWLKKKNSVREKKSKTIIACFERGAYSALQRWMWDVTLGGCVWV